MRRLATLAALLLLVPGLPAGGQEAPARRSRTVEIPAGSHRSLYDTVPRPVAPFRLDALPVTAADFRAFVATAPEWRPGIAAPVLVGGDYLGSWEGPLDPGTRRGPPARPVTQVSWFAARAYCRAAGGRLPTTDEWEYAASFPEEGWAGDRAGLRRRFLALHAGRPRPDVLPAVGNAFRNALGVRDLHGLVHEWTEDFNHQMLSGAGRDDRGLDRQLFCAAASAGVPDPSDYAAFLRTSLRASLDGTEGSLGVGFRCAYDLELP